ncbi:Peroxidase [Trema orientale]|uniref:Peroxidase n=1 Tax=Trema orientale TaxID=63057 RepID=A0A2P5ERU1_TREOI|nr:Peroxidase [Trema orientale]
MKYLRASVTIFVLLVSLLAVVGEEDKPKKSKGDFNHGGHGGDHGGDFNNGGHGGDHGGDFNNGGHGGDHGGLQSDFYRDSCPALENIVQSIVWGRVRKDPTMPAKLLRLHYHDCFVRGCDASILIDPVNGDNTTEKNAIPNRTIGGYDVIDLIKTVLGQFCPGTDVSCADIVALAARDAVSFQFRKPMWDVFMGRRDGTVSNATEALRDLPSAGSNYATLRNLFARFNLDETDLVALSGAHTIGVTHCPLVFRRLYNFSGKNDTDPALNPDYANKLKEICPPPVNPATRVELDFESSRNFDSNYFSGLTLNRGTLTSDAALLTDPEAKSLVESYQDFDTFKKAFAISMVKMGSIGVLTGNQGEIRKNCRVINQNNV